MPEDKKGAGRPAVKPTGQVDDNIDDLGRDVNRPERNLGDRATVERTRIDKTKTEKAGWD